MTSRKTRESIDDALTPLLGPSIRLAIIYGSHALTEKVPLSSDLDLVLVYRDFDNISSTISHMEKVADERGINLDLSAISDTSLTNRVRKGVDAPLWFDILFSGRYLKDDEPFRVELQNSLSQHSPLDAFHASLKERLDTIEARKRSIFDNIRIILLYYGFHLAYLEKNIHLRLDEEDLMIEFIESKHPDIAKTINDVKSMRISMKLGEAPTMEQLTELYDKAMKWFPS